MVSCLVCGAPDAEPHFGGISCRACAAFFRRYFHSKKSIVSCTCPIRFQNSHPCRECRIKKCLSIGMNWSKVQEKREKHAPKKGKLAATKESESPPSLPISPMIYIVSRDNSNISHTAAKWSDIQHKRYQIYNKTLDQVTYYETCCQTKLDTSMMWQIVETIFPQVERLAPWDQAAMMRNFMPKWSLLVAAIDFEKNLAMYDHVRTKEDYDDMIVQFYTSSIPADKKMSAEDILRVFEPFLRYYGLSLAIPLCKKEFDKAEYMALALLFLFDPAYTNLSEQCVELCHQIRKVIFRELKAYQFDWKGCDEMRFLDTVDTMSLLEKGEAKFQEELLLCEMHNVHIHEDYRLMMNQHNY